MNKKLYNDLKELLHVQNTCVDIPCTLETKLIIPKENTNKVLFVPNRNSKWSLPFTQVSSQNSIYQTALLHANEFTSNSYNKGLEFVGVTHHSPGKESVKNKISFCFKTDPISSHNGVGEWRKCDTDDIDPASKWFFKSADIK